MLEKSLIWLSRGTTCRSRFCALTPRRPRCCQHSSLVSSAQLSCLMVSPWRMWKNSRTLTRCSSQMAREPRRSEVGLILLVPHSLVYNPAFGRGVKYRCAQRAVVRSILLYGCETCPVWEADERMLEVFDNGTIRREVEIAHQQQNSSAASASLAYPRSSSKEEFIGLVTMLHSLNAFS